MQGSLRLNEIREVDNYELRMGGRWQEIGKMG